MTVTTRALIRRMNRKLAPQKKTVGQTRGLILSYTGEFYVRDYSAGGAIRYLSLSDLESMARRLGALGENETIVLT